MNGYTVNQDSGLSGVFSDSTEELRALYESVLSGKANGNILASCPVLGVQTVASETTNTSTEYPRQDGISSLPLMLGLSNFTENGLRSPVETTVIDSSSPLDGISLSHLLYAIVEVTPDCLPAPEYHRYHGNTGVIVDMDEISCSVCVEMTCDSSRLKIAKSRMLKLCPPMTGDVVRVIRGAHLGSVGCITSQNDGSRAVVKLDDESPPAEVNISDLVRLDSSQCSSGDTMATTPPGVEDSMPTDTHHASPSPPTYSTGWRVNSPIPPSPIDSGTYENSPTSSLISNSVTSPNNSWNTSNDPCPIKDFSFGLPSESHNPSPPSSSPGNMYSSQSLPNPSTTAGIFNGSLTKTETYQGAASVRYTSLPPAYNGGGNMLNVPSPHGNTSPLVSPSNNLYPVLNTTTDSNGYSPQPSPAATCSQSGSHVSYPTLPSYAAIATPPNYPLTVPNATYPQQQQPQYTPVLLGNASTGYAIYGYQQPSPTTLYQSNTGIPMHGAPQPQGYARVQVGPPSHLYPQLQAYSSPSMSQQQPFPHHQQQAGFGYANNNLSNRSKPSPHSLYPKLPPSLSIGKQQQPSPWDEFRLLVNSVQNRLPSQKRSLEMVIDLAIEALSHKEPPNHWYNPLAHSDDNEMSTDVSTESVTVSALCPLIRMKMDYPCRGLECTHLQCFDAKAYLRLALKRRSQLVSSLKGSGVPACHTDNGWKCPTCGKVVSVNQLYIDKYLRKAIATYCDAAELEFKGPGTWVPYEKRQDLSNSVIDLTMDSDEDM